MERTFTEACSRYGITVDELTTLSQTQHNFVGSYGRGGNEFILRITKESHRPFRVVMGEVDWINYLSEKSISVSIPVPSVRGQLVEKIEIDNYVTVVSFVKAEGRPPTDDDLLKSGDHIREMGRLMGQMHVATKGYAPRSHDAQRPHWYEDANSIASIDLPESENEVIQEYVQLNQYLSQLPVSGEVYGLVHMDFHQNNLFFDGMKITMFDFDACRYSWFINDIAVAVFYAIPLYLNAEAGASRGNQFLKHFMQGYRGENTLGSEWFKHIPAFIRHREIGRYIKIWRSCNGNIDSISGWAKDFMQGRKERITRMIPYVELDLDI